MDSTEIRNKSDEIDSGITINKREVNEAKQKFTTVLNKLSAYGSQFSEYLVASDFSEPFNDIDEELSKVKRDKQVVIFGELQGKVQSVVTYLESLEF